MLFENYRPISLFTAISKIFECVVFNQLYDHLTKHNLLVVVQYGFRKRHSTENAALELVDIISNVLDNRKLPISIFLDLSKAFDTLDHQISLHKLYHYGIRNSALNWFSGYLTNRLQYIDIDGTKSNSRPLSTGVPQGSVLGLSFSLYIWMISMLLALNLLSSCMLMTPQWSAPCVPLPLWWDKTLPVLLLI